MTPTPTPPSIGALKHVLFAIVVILIGAGGCYLVLPFYTKLESRFLVSQAMGAFKNQQYGRAVAELNEAIALNPQNAQSHIYRGWAHGRMGNYAQAIPDFVEASKLRPNDEQLLYTLGFAYEKQHDYKNALAAYQQVLRFHPQSSMAYNDIGWLLATCPDAAVRDGKRAIVSATEACELSRWKSAAALDTLAAAYAETGDFDNAVKWETSALQLSEFTGTDAAEAQDRLTLYQSHQPYHRTE